MSTNEGPGTPDPGTGAPVEPETGIGPQPAAPPVTQQSDAAPDWAWARPAAEIRWKETEPLEYHRLLRGAPRYRWWKPLIALLLGLLYYLTITTVFTVLVLVPYLLISGDPLDQDALVALAIPDTQKPISLVLGLGSVALMIPAVWLALLSVGLTPIGRVWSVALRIRWGLLLRSAGPAVVALVVMNAVGIGLELLLDPGMGETLSETPRIDWQLALWSAVLILLLVPVQAAAEELVFRGMLMQVIGSWLRSPWLAIIIPSVLFAFAHIYDIWGLLAVLAMGLTAAWISWRTGGLEAAITLHVINNWVAFGFMVLGVGGQTGQSESAGGPGSLLGTVVGLVLYAWWVDRSFARRDGVRTRIDLVQDRGPASRPARAGEEQA